MQKPLLKMAALFCRKKGAINAPFDFSLLEYNSKSRNIRGTATRLEDFLCV